MIQVPPAIIERVGQGNSAELARLRGIQQALLHLEASVDAAYQETSTTRTTTAKQTILVQVNINAIPGVEIVREYHRGNLFYAEVRFDQGHAQELALVKINQDLDELDWLFNRPQTAGRRRGLARAWAAIQQDLMVCNLLGVKGVTTPDRKIQEEFRGPKLIFVDDGIGSRSIDLSQRDLANRICRLYSDPDGTRTVELRLQYKVSTELDHDDATHSISLQFSLNGTVHSLREEIVTPRNSFPTPSQILGAFGPQLEEIISSH